MVLILIYNKASEMFEIVPPPNSGIKTVWNHSCEVPYIVGRKLFELIDTSLYEETQNFYFKIPTLDLNRK